MANAKDRLNQLQQYMDFYRAQNTNGGFGNGAGSFSYAGGGGNSAATMADWANAQLENQNKQQNMEDENATFKGMYSGGGQSSQAAYVHPQMQMQDNPYSARAMQMNNDPYSGSGGGQDISNTLAQMFRGGNKRLQAGG